MCSRDSFRNNERATELGANKFCECYLYKENIDTLQAVSLIARHLRFFIWTTCIGFLFLIKCF